MADLDTIETVGGARVPSLGFGTARMDSYDERRRAIDAALEAGYRHLDTAQVYGSEDAVGDAIAESSLDREDVFVTTKLAGENCDHDGVHGSTRESLEELRTDYVDLLLIHWPNDDVPHAETIGAMNELQDDGLVRHVGVSNFSVEQLRDAQALSETPVVANQVEYNPYERVDDLLAYCIDQGVTLTAYSPLAVGDVFDDEALATVGERHGKGPGQVAIRWLLQQPMVGTVPMSSNPEHVRSNCDVWDFELSDAEMREVFALNGALDDELARTLGL